MIRSKVSSALVVLAIIGCTGSNDDEPFVLQVSRDGGASDTGVPDAGPRDGGASDAGFSDAGPRDAGMRDVGVPDAGAPDAGPPDGGVASCWPLGPPLGAGNGPQRRGSAASAFDDRCGRLIVYGGDRSEPVNCSPTAPVFLDDMVVYDVATEAWYEMPVTSVGPGPRERGGAIWDAARERFVLYGGRFRPGAGGQYTYFNDLWAFDPSTRTWTQLVPSAGAGPLPGANMVVVADPPRDRLIIHGGGTTTPDFTRFIPHASTWAYDLGSNMWSPIGAASTVPTPGLLFHGGALDTTGQRLVLFGGGGEDAFIRLRGDTWILDVASGQWSQASSGPSPAPSITSRMVFDAPRARIVLFGGRSSRPIGATNDVWVFDLVARTWNNAIVGDTFNAGPIAFCQFPGDFTNVDLQSPERREQHIFKAAGGLAIMHGGRTDCGLANDTWRLDLATLSWTEVQQSPTGMTCFRNGNVNCADPSARLCD